MFNSLQDIKGDFEEQHKFDSKLINYKIDFRQVIITDKSVGFGSLNSKTNSVMFTF